MNAINTAHSGMQASMMRLNASASRIASASSAASADPATAAAQPDIALEMVEQLSAKLSFEANVSVVQRARDAEKSLFELWA